MTGHVFYLDGIPKSTIILPDSCTYFNTVQKHYQNPGKLVSFLCEKHVQTFLHYDASLFPEPLTVLLVVCFQLTSGLPFRHI